MRVLLLLLALIIAPQFVSAHDENIGSQCANHNTLEHDVSGVVCDACESSISSCVQCAQCIAEHNFISPAIASLRFPAHQFPITYSLIVDDILYPLPYKPPKHT